MPNSSLYGKPKTYPYYFNVHEGKKMIMGSGTFKTRKAAKEAAESWVGGRKQYHYRVIDRRKK